MQVRCSAIFMLAEQQGLSQFSLVRMADSCLGNQQAAYRRLIAASKI